MPVSQYPQLQSFLDYLRFEKRYSQHTYSSYETDLIQFLRFVCVQYDSPRISEISSTYVRSWLAEMRADNISAKTLNRKISSLKSFFKYLLKIGLIEASPMGTIVSPKVSKRLPTVVAEAEMQNLKAYIEFPDTWKGSTAKLILAIFYNTGMRLSELVNLKENHIDAANNQIKVLGKGNKERIIPVSGELMEAITAYISSKKKEFGHPLSDNLLVKEDGKALYSKYVYLVVKENLGHVTTLQKKSPHVLRHTFATHLTNGGADLNAIKDLLGHSSLAATQIYTHNTISKLKDIHKKAHPKA